MGKGYGAIGNNLGEHMGNIMGTIWDSEIQPSLLTHPTHPLGGYLWFIVNSCGNAQSPNFLLDVVSHWSIMIIDVGGESLIVSHFVESIFSGSWVGIEEKECDQCTMDVHLLIEGSHSACCKLSVLVSGYDAKSRPCSFASTFSFLPFQGTSKIMQIWKNLGLEYHLCVVARPCKLREQERYGRSKDNFWPP